MRPDDRNELKCVLSFTQDTQCAILEPSNEGATVLVTGFHVQEDTFDGSGVELHLVQLTGLDVVD